MLTNYVNIMVLMYCYHTTTKVLNTTPMLSPIKFLRARLAHFSFPALTHLGNINLLLLLFGGVGVTPKDA